MAILELIQSIDESVFQLVNSKMSNNIFDSTLVFFRNKYLWAPLYVFLIVKTILNFKQHAYIILLSAVVAFSITDYVSSSVIKPMTERERPCNNEELSDVRVKAPCRNSYSFVSSHASNHSVIAIFFFLLFKRKKKKWPGLLFLWAALISIAQVYVGLHYPSDVTCGFLLGIIIGYLTYSFLKKYYLKPYNVNMEL